MTITEIMDVYRITKTQLSRKFNIPYRTVQNWTAPDSDSNKRTAPAYVTEMIEKLLATEYAWWLIEEVRGDIFETRLDAEEKADAIKEARRAWDRLSRYDQKHRGDFYIIQTRFDPEEGLDLDNEIDSVDLLAPTEAVYDENGREVNYAAAVELMDDELREDIHSYMAPCSNQEFYDEYVKRHFQEFKENFTI